MKKEYRQRWDYERREGEVEGEEMEYRQRWDYERREGEVEGEGEEEECEECIKDNIKGRAYGKSKKKWN